MHRIRRHTRRWAAVATTLAMLAGGAVVAAAPEASAADVSLVPHRLIGGPAHAGLYGWGATTMRDGSVLIGDYWNLRVLHYATDGTYLGVFIGNAGFGATQHQAPYGLAVDPDNGDVYMADTDRYQVDRYSESGVYLNSFGQNGLTGNTTNKFQYPSRVAVRNGYVYISDTWANRIVVYKPTGTVQEFQFGVTGSANGQFKAPRALDFDANGLLYVADHGNKRIQVFNVDPVAKTATFVRKFGSKYNAAVASPPGDAVIRGDMRGLVVDDAENVVYLVDAEGNKVHKFSTSGAYLGTFGNIGPKGTEPGRFWDGGREITIDGAGHLWVGDMPNFRVQVFDKNGNFLFMRPDPPEEPAPGGFNGPRGVAVDAAGNIFVVDTYNQRVEKFAPDGSFTSMWGRRGRDDYSFNYPRTIAIDPTDQSVVLVDTDNNRIKSYTNDGVFQWESGTTGKLLGEMANPHGIDVGADGRIYVADTNNARVQVLDHVGTPLYMFGVNGTAPGQFKRPRGVVVDDSNGHIFVADATREVVQEFTNTGTYVRSFGGPGTTPDKLRQAFDVEVDGTYVYVSDTVDNSIKVYLKADASFVGRFGSGGPLLGQLRDPQGMELANGHLYVAERYNDRVTDWRVATDTVAPGVAIDPPAGHLPTTKAVLTGTASDDGVVNGVAVQIQNPATSQWWQANNTWGAAPVSLAAKLGTKGATSTTWSYTWPGPAGDFSVTAVATDGVGHTSAPVSQPFSTRVDVTEPDSSISSPTNNQTLAGRPIPISGSVVDDVAIAKVDVAIKNRSNNLWWDPATSTWASAVKWIPAGLFSPGTTASGWTYSFDDTASLGSGSYFVQARGTDVSGRVEAAKPSVNFTDPPVVGDTTPPGVTVNVPAGLLPAGKATLTGTATDNTAIVGVKVSVQDPNSGLWWQANQTWGASPATFNATVTGVGTPAATWSYTWPGPAGAFTLTAVATDGAALQSAPATEGFLTAVDAAEPESVISSPANNAVIPGRPVPITGIVTDDVAVARLEISIKDRGNNLWWDPATQTWGTTVKWIPTTLSAPGTASSGWTYAFDDTAGLGSGLYFAQVRGVDASGTIETTRPQVKFSV